MSSHRLRRKKNLRRALGLLALCVMIALALVLVRSCSERMNEPYDKGYHPMDVKRQGGGVH